MSHFIWTWCTEDKEMGKLKMFYNDILMTPKHVYMNSYTIFAYLHFQRRLHICEVERWKVSSDNYHQWILLWLFYVWNLNSGFLLPALLSTKGLAVKKSFESWEGQVEILSEFKFHRDCGHRSDIDTELVVIILFTLLHSSNPTCNFVSYLLILSV